MKLIHALIQNGAEAFPSIVPTPNWKAPLPFALVLLLATFGLLTTTFATAQSPLADSFNPGADGAYVYSLAVQADGKVLVGGQFTTLGGQPRHYMGRLNSDGTLDAAFNPGADSWVNCLVVQADGKILVGGYFTELGGQPRSYLGRLNPDGTLDTTFNQGADRPVSSLAVQADGKILVGGNFTTLGGQPHNNLGRLNLDGTLDATFSPATGAVLALALQADGKILAGGDNLHRLNADGTPDATFNPGLNRSVLSLALQADGKILVGGTFAGLAEPSRNYLGRLNPNGTLDATFNPALALEEWYPYLVACLTVQADGKILAGGSFYALGEQPRNSLARFNADGTVDATFNPGAGSYVLSMAVQADGKILVGGGFLSLGGQPRKNLGRLENTSPATQVLSHDGSTITWLRGGTAPEVWRTSFEYSADGMNWTLLGAGTRFAGGWQLAGVSLSAEAHVRARGYVAGGDDGSGWFVESYAGRPHLVAQPASRTNDASTIARFWVVAGGTEPLSYQWFKDGIPLADQENVTGATSPTLAVAGVLKADDGAAYRVVISNAFGSVTSLVATLTVQDPAILVPPLGLNASVGESVSLSVTAGGTPPLNYQWYHDGLAVPGASGTVLTINSLSGRDAGYYSVEVSNLHGSVTSPPAPLTVNGLPTADAAFDPAPWGSVYSMVVQTDGKILVGAQGGLGRINPDGTSDATFNSGPAALSLALQADGKILVSGGSNNLGRLNDDGTADATFNPGANNSVRSLIVQADGKILVGGQFTTLGGQNRQGIGRLNPGGTLDSAFNPGASGGPVYSLAVQGDGKILVGGRFTTLGGQPRAHLGRLNPDGSLDSTFNPGVAGDFDSFVTSLAVQADGKILVVGGFTRLGGQLRNNLGRLKPDGTLDAAFNPGVDGSVSSVALQTDGKILLGGRFSMLGGQPRSSLGRLNPDGKLDPTFNPGVGIDYDVDSPQGVFSLAVQADGKILVGGRFIRLGGQPRYGMGRLDNTSPATQVLSHDGSTITWLRGGSSPEVWRTTFEHSADGVNWTLLGVGSRISGGWQLPGLPLLAEGTLRARGYATGGLGNGSRWFVELESYVGRPGFVSQPASRTNNAGTTAQFQTIAGGTELLSYQWFKEATPLTDQDNVTGATTRTLTLAGVLKADEGAYHLVVSNSFGTVTSPAVTLTVLDPAILVPPLDSYRAVGASVSLSVTAGGTPPLNYQWFHDGLAVPGANGPELTINSLSIADAGYYTVQVSNVLGSVTSSPVPLTVNGATADADFNPSLGGVLSLAVQADGKILVGGWFTNLNGQSRNYVGRLNADGTLDATFDPAPNSVVNFLAVQWDGKILLGGQFTMLGGQPRNSLGRLNPDGTVDATFNPGANGVVNFLAVQADGKILVSGNFTTLGGQPRNNFGRLNPDGTLDATFNPATGGARALALQADGKILVGGGDLHRLNPDGTLDATFNRGVHGFLNSLAVQADGKILVGGHFFTPAAQPPNSLARLNPDGTPDATFTPEPGGDEDDDDGHAEVFSLALQADGKILVGGRFTTLGGQPRNNLGRLNPDGTLDHTFNPGIDERDYPYFDSVNLLAVQADGKILVSGNFFTLGGQPRRNFGRLNNTGPAIQALVHDGSLITWLRGGTSPEVWRTTFESSDDGVNWTLLGAGTRISGGWQLGVSISPAATVRARGYAAGGNNASGWLVETTWNGPAPIRLSLVRQGATVVLNWIGGQGPYQVEQTADASQPDSWQNLGPAAHTNSMALPLGPGSLFLRVRGQ